MPDKAKESVKQVSRMIIELEFIDNSLDRVNGSSSDGADKLNEQEFNCGTEIGEAQRTGLNLTVTLTASVPDANIHEGTLPSLEWHRIS